MPISVVNFRAVVHLLTPKSAAERNAATAIIAVQSKNTVVGLQALNFVIVSSIIQRSKAKTVPKMNARAKHRNHV
jgi:hypothetical protein